MLYIGYLIGLGFIVYVMYEYIANETHDKLTDKRYKRIENKRRSNKTT